MTDDWTERLRRAQEDLRRACDADARSNAIAAGVRPTEQRTVRCDVHGESMLTDDEYRHQLSCMHDPWRCPVCGRMAVYVPGVST